MESMPSGVVPDPRIPCNDGMARVITEHEGPHRESAYRQEVRTSMSS